ncbi:GET complex subunit GET2 [Kluyveromyces lactis]|uniref:Golgi to ER traffic protein 2 n=1 Tax=Kluyveromyces lactis (strain ATCC 8585 / CBS 2359 / DSM 70799 / NBRC 1267 / NRRL Y-1140 / WM37) TaxID=284590 RepID=GET2_KLULA|nr:uncharacterized protein KLLA0_C09196g [Kluyveromyces lactis]Q6CTY0.1 RecName: Full=Golgi to ER traffic protein 2 [Kluyveromyces lactis NRRL Y-1140]CAH01460.1 KLLA0C09196p [Kluyveromyces lactis]|eukprot:XP_452609.1 uncharacterized protein KLLA0_C09196g [Kluyveromyces lactis]
MATELSDAEKRKLLRERRQQKFSNGGASSRLNKITGQQQNSFLSSTSVLDEPKVTPSGNKKSSNVSDEEVEKSTKEIQDLLSSIPGNKDNSETDAAETNPEVALFQQLLKMQQQGGGFQNGSPDASTPDLFSSLLNNDTNTTASATQMLPNFVDEKVLKYYKFKVSKLKSYIILIKWALLAPYVYFIMHPNPTVLQASNLLSQIVERSNFFSIFTGLEIVFISIYYQMLKKLQRDNNVTATQNAGGILKYLTMIPEGILPIRNIQGKIGLALEYFDVASMYVTDICFVLVLFGVMKYYHSSFPISVPIEPPIAGIQ